MSVVTLFSHEVTLLLPPPTPSTTKYGNRAGKNKHASLVQWATLILWMKKRSLLISMKNPHPALEWPRKLQSFQTSITLQDNFLSVTRQCPAQKLSFALWGQRTHKGGLRLKTFDHAQQLSTPYHHELLFTRFVGLHLVPQLPLLRRTGLN